MDPSQIIERNLYFKLFFAVRGEIPIAVQKRLFMRVLEPQRTLEDTTVLNKVAFAFHLYRHITQRGSRGGPFAERDFQVLARVFILANRSLPASIALYDQTAQEAVKRFNSEWSSFMSHASRTKEKFWRKREDPKTKTAITVFEAGKWMQSQDFQADLVARFGVQAAPKPDRPFIDPGHFGSTVLNFEERRLQREEKRMKRQHLIALQP